MMMMTEFRRWKRQGVFCIALLLFSLAAEASPPPLRLAVAANFKQTLEGLQAEFEQLHPWKLRVSYGSTGQLYTQITQGAPYDIFMAADRARPEKAMAAALAVPGTLQVYARGQLVLWSPDPNLFVEGYDFLSQGQFKRLAIANPDTAPYGLAARQTIDALKLRDSLQPRLVRGNNVAQTLQFVATRNAEVGFVAASLLQRPTFQGGSSWQVPAHLHAPIDQALVLLEKGRNHPGAQAWLHFLNSQRTRIQIANTGYQLLTDHSGDS